MQLDPLNAHRLMDTIKANSTNTPVAMGLVLELIDLYNSALKDAKHNRSTIKLIESECGFLITNQLDLELKRLLASNIYIEAYESSQEDDIGALVFLEAIKSGEIKCTDDEHHVIRALRCAFSSDSEDCISVRQALLCEFLSRLLISPSASGFTIYAGHYKTMATGLEAMLNAVKPGMHHDIMQMLKQFDSERGIKFPPDVTRKFLSIETGLKFIELGLDRIGRNVVEHAIKAKSAEQYLQKELILGRAIFPNEVEFVDPLFDHKEFYRYLHVSRLANPRDFMFILPEQDFAQGTLNIPDEYSDDLKVTALSNMSPHGIKMHYQSGVGASKGIRDHIAKIANQKLFLEMNRNSAHYSLECVTALLSILDAENCKVTSKKSDSITHISLADKYIEYGLDMFSRNYLDYFGEDLVIKALEETVLEMPEEAEMYIDNIASQAPCLIKKSPTLKKLLLQTQLSL